MTAIAVYAIALAIIAGFGYLWYKTSPAKGSGWALFACVLIAVCMNAPATPVLGGVVYGVMCLGFGASWYFSRDRQYSGWLLAVSILSALSAVDKLL